MTPKEQALAIWRAGVAAVDGDTATRRRLEGAEAPDRILAVGKAAAAMARAAMERFPGVPTLIVNGKFSTGGRQAGSNANIIKVVDYLVARERDGMVPVAQSAQP